MYSVINQTKTLLRDRRGDSVYRRSYLCDTSEDLLRLPVDDAPGSLAYVAADGGCYVLDHEKAWQICPAGGVPWQS